MTNQVNTQDVSDDVSLIEPWQAISGIYMGGTIFVTDEYGIEYLIPGNYAAKSILVPGDTLKLTISKKWRASYKITNTCAHVRKTGRLIINENKEYMVVVTPKKSYLVLPHAVRFYNYKIGDTVSIYVNKDDKSFIGAALIGPGQ